MLTMLREHGTKSWLEFFLEGIWVTCATVNTSPFLMALAATKSNAARPSSTRPEATATRPVLRFCTDAGLAVGQRFLLVQ